MTANAAPYSNVVVVPAGDLIVLSGQGPLDENMNLVGETIEEQTRVTLERCRRLLEQEGCTFVDVFKVAVFMSNLDDWGRFNATYRELMPPPFPARTTIGCQLLLGMQIEIDMWASRPAGPS